MRKHQFSWGSAVLACAVATGCGGKSSNSNNGGQASATGGNTSIDSSATGGDHGVGGTTSNATYPYNGAGTSAVIGTTSIALGGSAIGAGGAMATGGLPGTGGKPNSSVVGAPAVDVLFMVDNSNGMADKQQILAAAAQHLIARLVQPNCVTATGAVVGQSQLDGTCAQGTPEFKPVNDLHVGVVTSSLGDHGEGTLCTPGAPTSFVDVSGNVLTEPNDVNDQGHMMGAVTRGAAVLAADSSIKQSATVKLEPQGFLAWGSSAQVPAAADVTAAQHAAADLVTAAAESGCGLESQLEAWFRFLVNPVPPIMPITKPDGINAQRLGSDDALLAQRAAFLRPNSVLAVVMLTDENDCSLRDTDVGWVAADTRSSIATGSSQCVTNPNDKCCYSCTASPPMGCASGCTSSTTAAVDDSVFQVNLRCYHEKRRFGYEFMYPTSRYVVALTKPVLCPDQTYGDMDCDCAAANASGASCSPGSRRLPNPLFSDIVGTSNAGTDVLAAQQVAPRGDNSMIFLTGVIGVPWQDVATTDASGNVVYIPTTDPAWSSSGGTTPATSGSQGIWPNIYGNDNANIEPGDPHMVESVEPRSGVGTTDPVNGHDWNTAYEDLEYACTTKLPTARACSCNPTSSDYNSCKYLHFNDCCDLSFNVDGRGGPGGNFNKPVCQVDGETGNDENTQYYYRAFPGLREVAVLHDYALHAPSPGNAVVGSICAKDLTSASDRAGYGYNPVIDALINQMKSKLPAATP